ncbi:MAG TPA: metallophosphoesterase [Candidatus Gallacutalibacter stercoravium]|nr:metallophosphoesterase [Candidatus Gallacutalibacter stercoravium]
MKFSKKWFQKGLAATLSAALLMGQAAAAMPASAADTAQLEQTLKIAVLSDTHYLSPDMIADTADFEEHLNSDRKMFAQSDAFLTALLDTVKQDDPDVLLISGDLTKDGEKEGHEELAEKLEQLEQETGVQVYITPGNHDLNNSNAMNFNTANGEAVPAGRTSQEDYKQIYADLVYNDESVIATFTPAEGKQGGGLSYVARPKDGFTIISIDSARYSADNTESGTDEHETSGNVSPEMEAWIVEQTQAAKQRGDTVIGLQHHGMVPHFSMEPDLLPMYLVNDYERLANVYADAGMSYIFTGHMHANDIATVTTEAGNTLYDIETGSVVTYPSPARSVTLTRTIANGTVSEDMNVKTYTHVGPVTYVNPVTQETETIEDISEYGRQHGFSNDMLSTTVNGFLHSYYEQILTDGGSKKALEALINSLLGDSLPVENMTLEQLIDVALPILLPGADSGEEIYYDSAAGGIAVNMKVSIFTLSLLIPNEGIKDSLDALLTKLDNEVLAKPEVMDSVIENLLASLTQIQVSEDGENVKTLLDYANYIYQSHLGGEDSQEQPAWVQEATAKIQNGELLGTVLTTVTQNIAGVVDQILENVSLEELLGASGWNNDLDELVAIDGRTPLIQPTESGKTIFAAALVILGWTDGNDDGILEIPAGSNPEIGYSAKEFLDKLGSLSQNLNIDIVGLLNDLLIGTPENPGLIDDEIKAQLNGWLLNLVQSMGTDSNYAQDNDTAISYEWKLLTDRTALDEAIAEAEKLDLSKYTDETAKAVTDALAAAKALPLTATQAEMDAAAQAITDAINALQEKTASSEEQPGSSTSQPENPADQNGQNSQGDNNQPGGSNNQAGDPTNTGENSSLTWIVVLTLLSGAATAAIVLGRKKLEKTR